MLFFLAKLQNLHTASQSSQFAGILQQVCKVVMVLLKVLLSFILSISANVALPDGKGHESCPTLFAFDNKAEKCLCHRFAEDIICSDDDQTVHLVDGICATFDNDSGKIDVGRCPYMLFNGHLLEDGYVKLPQNASDLNQVLCGPWNREGYLCHKCKPGYGMTIANVFQHCVKCKYSNGVGWIFYFILQLIPLTVLFFVITIFRISLARPPMRGFVFFYQTAVAVLFTNIHRFNPPHSTNSLVLKLIHYIYIVTFGIWGMSLTENVPGITDFCVHPDINIQQAFTLKQIQSTYPLLLVIITYTCIQLHARNCQILVWLWKPFHKCFSSSIQRWNSKYSLIDVFSTFLVLSFSRYNIQLYFLLSGQYTFSLPTNEWNRVLLYNPGVQYFHPVHHLPYAIALFFIFLVVAVPPVLVLTFYQNSSFQIVLTCFGLNNMPPVHIFVDLFQGCFKDGTNGSYDLRFTASLYLITTVIAMISFVGCSFSTYENCSSVCVFTMAILLLLFFALLRPYKDQRMNISDSLLLASSAIISFLLASTSKNFEHMAFNVFVLITVLIIIAIPHVILFGYFLHKLLAHILKLKCSQQLAATVLVSRRDSELVEITESLPDRIDNPYSDEGKLILTNQ